MDDIAEGVAVHLEGLEVAGVDADDPRPGVHRALDLLLVVHLHQRGEADRLGALDQRHQGRLLEGRDDQQREVGAVRAGLPQLVGGDDEVLAEQRGVHGGADGVQVRQRAAEAALLGQHADRGGTAGRVVGRQGGRVRDRGQRALGRAGALDLADHPDAVAAQCGHAVLGVRGLGGELLELVQRDPGLSLGEVLADPFDDRVEHTHSGAPIMICRY